MAISLGGELNCTVHDSSFKCSGLFIASDVEHTIYAETGDLLLFLLDTTSDMAKCIEEKYLQGKDYALIDEDTVNRMIGIWLDAKDDLKEADRRLLETGGIIAGNVAVTDDRIKKVLSFLEGCNTRPSADLEILAETDEDVKYGRVAPIKDTFDDLRSLIKEGKCAKASRLSGSYFGKGSGVL